MREKQQTETTEGSYIMFNLGRITEVLKEEIGQSGAEAVCDAVSFYLREGKEDFACIEDRYLLVALLMAMDADGLNFTLPEFDPLYHLQ